MALLLTDKVVTDAKTWKEWQQRWDAEENRAALLGLLHSAFDVPISDLEKQAERIGFLLKIAENHLILRKHLSRPWEELQDEGFKVLRDAHVQAAWRLEVAAKAFGVLAVRFFNPASKDLSHIAYCGHATTKEGGHSLHAPGLFSRILSFFLPCDSWWKLRNLDEHEESVTGGTQAHFAMARTFLLEACRTVLYRKDRFPHIPRSFECCKLDTEILEIMRKERLRCFEVLIGLRRLDLLLAQDAYPLEPEDCAHLEKLVSGDKVSPTPLATWIEPSTHAGLVGHVWARTQTRSGLASLL